MKLIIVVTFAITALASSCKKEHLAPEIKLNKVISNIQNKTAISYDLNYRIKYLDYRDTISTSAKTVIVKVKSDSLFGGYIWYSRKDSINDYIKYYNLNSFYVIDNNKKEVIRYDTEKPIPYGFTGNFDGKLLNTYFLKANGLNTLIHNPIYKSQISEDSVLLRLSVVYPDRDEITNQAREIIFDKSTDIVKQIIFKAELDSLQEYNEWNLHNVNYDRHSIEDLEEEFQKITKDYEFKEYQPSSKEENSPLVKGQIAGVFKGEYFEKSSESEFDLSDFSGNIIILDFWYRTCPPCIKSIPQLNNIHSKYESKGVKLFGLNDIDTDSISKMKLIPFIQTKNIKYPVVLIDNSISEKYNVRGYPTFYIINKNGEIEYSKLGYSKNLEKEVDSILTKILK